MKFMTEYMKKIFYRSAFTLMELMIVVIAVGLIAAFGIPAYDKAVERSYERDGINNLSLLYSAEQAYRARYGGYWPEATGACGGGNCGIAGGLTQRSVLILLKTG